MKCKVGDGDSFINGFQVGSIVDMIASVWVDPSSTTPDSTIWKFTPDGKLNLKSASFLQLSDQQVGLKIWEVIWFFEQNSNFSLVMEPCLPWIFFIVDSCRLMIFLSDAMSARNLLYML